VVQPRDHRALIDLDQQCVLCGAVLCGGQPQSQFTTRRATISELADDRTALRGRMRQIYN
jgi:hypothetical protein